MPLRFDHPDHSSDVGFGYPGLTSSSDEPPVSGARNGYAPIRDGGTRSCSSTNAMGLPAYEARLLAQRHSKQPEPVADYGSCFHRDRPRREDLEVEFRGGDAL